MEETIELTKELIRFKTMHKSPDEIERCASFIKEWLKKERIHYRRFDFEGVPSIMVMPESGYAPVLLMSHFDVVDGPDELFVPDVRNGNLYGRGSLDDKYAAALSLVLLKKHVQRLRGQGRSQEDLPFGILITGDEEIGGANGAKKALKELKADFCIALDGGVVEKIVVKEKGVMRLKLVAKGKTAHAARPWLGENAIEKLIADYQKLAGHFSHSQSDHWNRTLNFSRIQAGKSTNQVPDYAEALFDIRYTDDDDMEKVVRDIREEIEGELIIESMEPVFMGGDSPFLELLLSVAGDSRTGFEHGASDARFLSALGIDGIVWGANGDSSAHSLEEHVNIESVYSLYGILDRFVAETVSLRNDG
jgi:succinyl-diaminopimelate desuccinylase